MLGIAGLKDGEFYYIHQLDRVDEAYASCLGGMMTTIAKDIELKITPKKIEAIGLPVKIAKVYGDGTMWE